MALTGNPIPQTPSEPVTEILHGVPVTDPYRWLEDQNSLRTRTWLEEQTTYTRGYLDAVPGRNRFRKRIEELLAVKTISEPWKVGDRYFFLKREPYQEQPVITMREGEMGEDIPLINPVHRGEGSVTAVGILNISRDGKLLAYSVRRGGHDTCAIEFLDVEHNATLPDRLAEGSYGGLVFSSDSKGFYYAHAPVTGSRPHYRAAYWHKFGTKPDQDIETFVAGESANLRLQILRSRNGQRLAYLVTGLHDSHLIDLYVHDLPEGGSVRRIVQEFEGMFCPFLFVDNQLIAATDWKAPNSRIVSIDIDRPKPENWRELVPESDLRIQGIACAGDLIFVRYVDKALTRVEIFDQSGERQGNLPCPSDGTVRLLAGGPHSDTLFYEFTSFSRPRTILRFQAGSGKQDVWAHAHILFDPSSIEVEHVSYPSKDGTQIPMFLVWQRGRRPAQLPTFLTGYGGFGASVTPQFSVYATVLIELGFLYAVANLRGGGEFGRRWHLAGMRHNRQTAIDDFIAAAEWLVGNGHASPEKLAIGGGSNAGLLVGAALTQRPDLFRAVICLGPLLDMLRYHKFDLANMWVKEFGSSDNADDFRFLEAYSPYHQVRFGTAYPAAMLISGDADTRCNPLHVRKMTARLQAATTSQHPILLDYRPAWGHTPVQPLSARVEALTDRVAFLCGELGMTF